MRADADLSIGAPPPPQVEPGAAVDLDDELLAPDPEAPHVEESVVRRVLRGAGGAANMAFGDDDVADHWRFTDVELDELVPPLTAYINRRPKLRRMVAHGDEAVIALVMANYLERNLDDGRRARKARKVTNDADLDGEAGRAGRHPAAEAGGADQGNGAGRAPGLGIASW